MNVDLIRNYQGLRVNIAKGTIERYFKGKNLWVLVGCPGKDGYTKFQHKKKDWRAHRFISEAFLGRPLRPDEIVNHLNHKIDDNRLANLQITTKQGNNQYRKAREGSTSQYIGVSWVKREKKWKAQIRVNGKYIHIGYFKTEHDAAEARDKVALEYNLKHGANFRLNDMNDI